MQTEGTNKAVGADQGKTKAPTGTKEIMYKGSDQSVSAIFRGVSITFKRGVAKTVPAAAAESFLKQPEKFTAKLDEKLDVAPAGVK